MFPKNLSAMGMGPVKPAGDNEAMRQVTKKLSQQSLKANNIMGGKCHLLNDSMEGTRRLEEMKVAFGDNRQEHFCKQVKSYQDHLIWQEKKRVMFQGYDFKRMDHVKMVHKLARIVRDERLSTRTLHLAVYLMNRYCDKCAVQPRIFWVAAVTCLIIAGKMEERHWRIPSIRKLVKHIPRGTIFSFKLYRDLEMKILHFFEWTLVVPTVLTFVEFYSLFLIDEEELGYQQMIWNGKVTASTVKALTLKLVDNLLLGKPDERFPPSLVASGVVMLSRRLYGLTGWPMRLQFITGYSKWDVENCENFICAEIENTSVAACSMKREGLADFFSGSGMSLRCTA